MSDTQKGRHQTRPLGDNLKLKVTQSPSVENGNHTEKRVNMSSPSLNAKKPQNKHLTQGVKCHQTKYFLTLLRREKLITPKPKPLLSVSLWAFFLISEVS